MGKYLKQGYVRNLEWELGKENISYSKMVDMMDKNEFSNPTRFEDCWKPSVKSETIVTKKKK